MNTTAPSSPAHHGTSAAGHTQGGNASARGPGKPGSGAHASADQFANLLSLLNAGNELPADTLSAALDSGTETGSGEAEQTRNALAQDGNPNPLAGLLGWPGAPLPLLPAAAAAAASTGAAAEVVGTARLSQVADASAAVASGRSAQGQSADALTTTTVQVAEGLTPMSTPETLDPDTLAALARANTPGEANTDAAQGTAPVRITTWRSTTGLAPNTAGLSAGQAVVHGASTHASVSQTAFAQATLARTSGADVAVALAPQMRSTVQLDDRFAQTSADSEPTSSSAIGGTGGARHEALPGAAGAGGAGGGTGQEAAPDLSQGFSTPGEDTSASDAAAQAAMETDDSASASWGAQHLRHASVRVGEPGEQAIDIQLSMAGQEVRVEFRTDDAQTRASLAQDGGASLGELLQRSGLDLGGVSVGAQGQQAGQDPHARSPQGQAAPTAHRGREADAPAVSAAQPPRPRADGSRPLDLFV